MGNHEFCEDCGENDFHHHRPCHPEKVRAKKQREAEQKIKNERYKILENSFVLWMEDDAGPDPETLNQALKRIWPWDSFRNPVYTDDQGDAVLSFYDRYTFWVIVQASYRGNNVIRVAKK